MNAFDTKLKRMLASTNSDDLRQNVVAEIGDAMEWYEVNAKRMGLYSRALRCLAIGLGVIGVAWPMAILSLVSFDAADTSDAAGAGNIGYLAVALAAGVLAFDHQFGYSAAWMRYRLTLLEVERILLEFIDSWSELPSNTINQDTLTPQCCALARKARSDLLNALRAETTEWVAQMQLNIGGLVNGLSSRQGSNTVVEMFGAGGGGSKKEGESNRLHINAEQGKDTLESIAPYEGNKANGSIINNLDSADNFKR